MVLTYKSSELEVLADSSAVDHQEIQNKNNWTQVSSDQTDVDVHDGRKFFVNTATDLTECNKSAIFSKIPKITSVSYDSNGRILNTTFWLDRPALMNDYFQNPSLASKIPQVFVYLENETLAPSKENTQNFTRDEMETIEKNYHDLENVTVFKQTLANNNMTYEFEFNGMLNYSSLGHPQIKGMDIFRIIDGTKYRILYIANDSEFSKELPNIINMVKSFRIGNQTFDSPFDKQIPNFKKYSKDNVEIQYPQDWGYTRRYNPSRTIFFSPIHGPYLIGTGYLMSMDVPSAYNSPTDYIAKVMWWDSLYHRTWFKLSQEISFNGTTRTLEESPNYTQSFETEQNHDTITPFVFLPIDLSLFNSPNQYLLVFASEAKYINENGRLCDLLQISNQVSVPPPRFDIILSENSTSVGPTIGPFQGVKTVELKIKSFATSPANVTLSTSIPTEFKQLLDANFSQSKLYVPTAGWATTLLTLKSKPREFMNDITITKTLPIFTNVEFQKGGGIFTFNTHQLEYTSAQGHKPDDLALPVTIFSSTDYLIHVLSSWSTPVSVVVALAGIIGGGIGWILKRRT